MKMYHLLFMEVVKNLTLAYVETPYIIIVNLVFNTSSLIYQKCNVITFSHLFIDKLSSCDNLKECMLDFVCTSKYLFVLHSTDDIIYYVVQLRSI